MQTYSWTETNTSDDVNDQNDLEAFTKTDSVYIYYAIFLFNKARLSRRRFSFNKKKSSWSLQNQQQSIDLWNFDLSFSVWHFHTRGQVTTWADVISSQYVLAELFGILLIPIVVFDRCLLFVATESYIW